MTPEYVYTAGWLIPLLILLALVAGFLWYAWRRMQAEGIGNLPQTTRFPVDREDALRELDHRLERGDISREQYERMRRDIDRPAA